MQLRLDKYLADMGIGTRSEVKQYIRKKQVRVNQELPKGPQQKINPQEDEVAFQGKNIGYVEKEYWMFHKPAGCVSAVTDARHKTVLDYIHTRQRKDLFPVGRLDIDTEGLLLITNDGRLSHDLLSPGRHVTKTYFARVEGRVTQQDIRAFEAGIDIGEDKPAKPARLVILKPAEISEIELTITEGKYHQVKRMFEAVEKKVIYLKRTAMGPLVLDEALAPGDYRPLTVEERNALGIK